METCTNRLHQEMRGVADAREERKTEEKRGGEGSEREGRGGEGKRETKA